MQKFSHHLAEFPPAKPRQDVIDARSTRGVFQIFHRRPHDDRHVEVHLPDLTDQGKPVHPWHPIVGHNRGEFVFTQQVQGGGPGLHVFYNGMRKYVLQIPAGEKGAVGIIVYDQKTFGHEFVLRDEGW